MLRHSIGSVTGTAHVRLDPRLHSGHVAHPPCSNCVFFFFFGGGGGGGETALIPLSL